MNAPAKITPARPSVAQALTAIVDAMRVINASGALADAPTDLVNALDDGDTAARELLEWLGKQVPQRPMPYAEWVS